MLAHKPEPIGRKSPLGRNVLVVAPTAADIFLDGICNAAAREGWNLHRHVGPPSDVIGGAQLQQADVLLTSGALACDRRLFEAAPRLRAVISLFIGIEAIDQAAATASGVVVCNGQVPENYEGVAEGTILLALAAMYGLLTKEKLLREGRTAPLTLPARMLWRKTVGIVGFGMIAQAVARRLSVWDVDLLVHTRTQRPLPEYVQPADLESLLRRSDVVLLLTSLTSESRHLIDAARLDLLKSDAVLVNTSRGAVIDEAALVRWAERNPDALLALDIFETEPLPLDSPLRRLPNAVLTPHAIAGTREAVSAIRRAAVENVAAVFEGVPIRVCNPEVLPDWNAQCSPAPKAGP
jgi:phosphoglycerate dehydrogenase-like enzyme